MVPSSFLHLNPPDLTSSSSQVVDRLQRWKAEVATQRGIFYFGDIKNILTTIPLSSPPTLSDSIASPPACRVILYN